MCNKISKKISVTVHLIDACVIPVLPHHVTHVANGLLLGDNAFISSLQRIAKRMFKAGKRGSKRWDSSVHYSRILDTVF